MGITNSRSTNGDAAFLAIVERVSAQLQELADDNDRTISKLTTAISATGLTATFSIHTNDMPTPSIRLTLELKEKEAPALAAGHVENKNGFIVYTSGRTFQQAITGSIDISGLSNQPSINHRQCFQSFIPEARQNFLCTGSNSEENAKFDSYINNLKRFLQAYRSRQIKSNSAPTAQAI